MFVMINVFLVNASHTKEEKEIQFCFSPEDNEWPLPDVSRCSCKREDFECDYCFEAKETDPTVCVLSDTCPSDPTLIPENCVETWNKTKGYRLIPGDNCDPKDSADYSLLAPTTLSCTDDGTSSPSHSLSGGEIFAIIFGCLFSLTVCLVAILTALYHFNSDFHEKTQPFVAPIVDFISDCKSNLPRHSSSDGGHDYTILNVGSEPKSLLDDLEGDNNDDDLLDDEPAELDERTISKFTNKTTTKDSQSLSNIVSKKDDNENIFGV